ncbi:transferase 2, rSAM/selenodomain-associated [Tistlia consotensis]|uniref:Transferase 2, rSAM/selenodomain-associated n=1 Tax=Tistlia consotensis USBA 355 TaxID=560819 RepID=A0A1Y6C1U3_9PROT|nr:TIGR04283 family arsenosugar biosynthesis glycosyltransferase [Tistlia consotensis]SMF39048.1 transferase 2, rSAM/selenodomain-associated [Tistlia consotensis USBA 355]SNR36584.1 transferase 2, rSAM/selenodomain-associated [Tistlia consotensis]
MAAPHLPPSLLPRLSLVIPTLDAAADLPATLESLAAWPEAERIVVDGGSADGTAALAEAAGCRVLAGPRGRGRQLAAGAAAAGGDWLLFLHADTRLSPGWPQAAGAFLADPRSRDRAGWFRLRLDSPAAAARRVERLANWRARRLGLPYGDQGLLIGRALYESLGGHPPLPLMEDVALARRLGRRRLVPLGAEALTSAARYERDGWWRRPARNLCLLALYFAGVAPERLARLYG